MFNGKKKKQIKLTCLSAVVKEEPRRSSWLAGSWADLKAKCCGGRRGVSGGSDWKRDRRLEFRWRPDAADPAGFWWSCWLAQWRWVTWRCPAPRAGSDRRPQPGYCWSSYSLHCWLIPKHAHTDTRLRLLSITDGLIWSFWKVMSVSTVPGPGMWWGIAVMCSFPLAATLPVSS